jgi:hypothetical protein
VSPVRTNDPKGCRTGCLAAAVSALLVLAVCVGALYCLTSGVTP